MLTCQCVPIWGKGQRTPVSDEKEEIAQRGMILDTTPVPNVDGTYGSVGTEVICARTRVGRGMGTCVREGGWGSVHDVWAHVPMLNRGVALSAWPKDRQHHCYRSVQLKPVQIEQTLLTLAVYRLLQEIGRLCILNLLPRILFLERWVSCSCINRTCGINL